MDFDAFFPKVDEAAAFLKQKIKISPRVLVVLTGGLDEFVNGLQETLVFSAAGIPNFPKTKVEGHAGRIVFGKWKDVPLVCMQGRCHYYEGHTPQAVVFPYFVFEKLGVKSVVTTNAVGGINSSFRPGDIMVVTDHINMMGTNPLIGIAVQRKTDQFTGMTNAYDRGLREIAFAAAKKEKINLKTGTYMAVPGPSYETKAEIKAFRQLGADAIGMSTVFEVIACSFLKMKVLTFNCIANPAADVHKGEMHHEEVLKAVNQIQPKLVKLLRGVVEEIGRT
jgi:purine-nucleoside phosphorylase